MSTVAVIDYGMGNLHSVAKALEKVSTGTKVMVNGDPDVVRKADRVVLPGVGAIRDCMAEIRRLGFDELVREVVLTKPLLGVCVGMQALMDHSVENNGTDCLGILPGRVEFFGDDLRDNRSGERLKVPHMGWNQVHQVMDHPLWQGIAQDSRFYFVHSYYVEPAGPDLIAAACEYGISFTAAVARDNVFATQFHPEKSQHAGLSLYANFLKWDGTVK
ncbi:MAG: imidazole glycerol phosphate synthase subunit HisH [Gammaproteobacteria bacterium]|nr:imidazole glycerol phosphate synthase subunit HisH [Gammaproteobacteria bacterium]MDH5650254.1 imidazole glycerol phosphate synthase subunit HisH [Gammaproteobacteria bacterium]